MKLSTFAIFLLLLLLSCLNVSCGSLPSVKVPSQTQNIRVITFDLFAALMDTGSSVIDNIVRITAPYLTKEEGVKLGEQWLDHYGGTFWEYNSLARDPNMKFSNSNIFQLMLQEGLNFILKKMKIEERLPGNVQQELYTAWSQLKPWPKTGQVLNLLRNMTDSNGQKRFKLGVLSNGDRLTLQNATQIFKKENGFEFDYIIGSTDSGLFKPDPLFYGMVEKISSFNRNQILHVGGSPYDARGAKGYGYMAALNFGDENDFINLTGNPKYQVDFFLKDLSDLLKILDK